MLRKIFKPIKRVKKWLSLYSYMGILILGANRVPIRMKEVKKGGECKKREEWHIKWEAIAREEKSVIKGESRGKKKANFTVKV